MTKAKKIIYWVATCWLSLGLISTGIVQLLRLKDGTGGLDSMTHLGYPVYMLTLLGILKMFAVVALLLPKFPLLKEWTYAGISFLIAGALYSHTAMREPIVEILPALLLLTLTAVSWYLRPEGRKIISISKT